MHVTGRLEWQPALHIFVLSIGLCLVTLRSSSLLPAMVMHAAYNSADILLQIKYLH